ncbi:MULTISPECIES: hypothetical protein [Legionella]|uniref:Uncharacterized protein n=1 Tax=Legionella septentrionalis TaxID=2498109 RepID=A0A3S1CL81_9GAMM|nr:MULTISPECIES: hypothetical protein [Legionella]MCP0912974.1 hypothetical protein [Legionella sp. 27cVA30]RUQ85319.1 hypothetical protein EKM59_06675 [Legionella septentrionalis]RUQ96880.1 hypothetical protein ELY11_07170 [Legionella septentrionalis]RUR10945.1 hypothetical protein ELY14_03845 [Legionella septentrionalis]RUR15386.1 hypothetical protein ELY10_06175 [Legionella septentrionalis]
MKKILAILLILPSLSFSKSPSSEVVSSPWEAIPSPAWGVGLYRLSVPHGWLVYTGGGTTATTVFVPDEDHEWILNPVTN